MKVYDFIIVLKSNNHRLIDTISRMMLLLSIAIFSYTLSLGTTLKQTILLSLLIVGMLAWWYRCYQKQKKGETSYYRLGLLMATCGWLILSGYRHWITILFFIAVLLEKQVKFPREIAFDEQGLVFNSLPKKRYAWSEISNVVIKDGILTIDFANNKLIQKEIENPGSGKEDQEFNEFCRARLQTALQPRMQA